MNHPIKGQTSLLCAVFALLVSLSNSRAASVNVHLTWGSSFTALASSGATLSAGTTLDIGWFSPGTVPTNWASVNQASLSGAFNSLAQLSYTGGGEYNFTGDYTDALALNKAYLVITSGSGQLGVFGWALNSGEDFFLPRDSKDYPTDNFDVDTSVGATLPWIYNMTNFVGTVSSSGVQLASVSGAMTSQSITFGAIPSKSVGDSFVLSATASSSLPVTYTSSNPAVATVAGSTVTIVGSGSVVITASQSGNSTYSAATDVGQTITSYPTTALRLASLGTPVLSGGQTSVTHTFVGNPNAAYTIEYKNDLSAATWTSITAQTGANGTFTATFTSSGDYVNAWKNRMFFRAKNS